MRISDWSSDVCSSDLREELRPGGVERGVRSCERKLCLSDVRTAAEEGRGQAPRKRWGLQARQLSAGPNGSGRTAGQNAQGIRSEEHTSELQSLMRNSYAVFCLQKKKKIEKQKLCDKSHKW